MPREARAKRTAGAKERKLDVVQNNLKRVMLNHSKGLKDSD
jgi:hypothetical protein